MYRIILFLIFSCVAWSGQSQEKYSGQVYDVGTRLPLSGVDVIATNSGLATKSKAHGQYDLFLKHGLLPENSKHFFVLNNVVYWDYPEAVSVSVYAMNGQIIRTLTGTGSLMLPELPLGYYVVHLLPVGEKLFIFSDGSGIQTVDKLDGPNYVPDTSLIFSKERFFDREFSLESNRLHHANILRKSYDTLDYFQELIRPEAFVMLQGAPSVTNWGGVHSIKVLYDFVQDEIYYANVQKYPNHYWFAVKQLGFQGDGLTFFSTQYGNSPTRFLYSVSIDYHENIDKYIFTFGSYDQIGCEGIQLMYEKLLASSFFGDKLYFYANTEDWTGCANVPIISSEELYEGQNYQALNLAESYGFLKKMEVSNLPNAYLSRHDIVLLNDVPNDLSVVAGIITTEFQTPLSHINILSHNRHTPNMALKNGWTNQRLDTLLNELVYLRVESDSFVIRRATLDEAQNYWQTTEPQTPIVLEKDTTTSGLIHLEDVDIQAVKTIGGKAANFAELVGLGTIPLPENYFAIPFYYYEQHIKGNGIDAFIDNMLGEEQFQTNLIYRKAQLKTLRNLIKDAVIDQELVAMVKEEIHDFDDFASYRFRSSTNAEDLEDFSGAGLYSSHSAKKNHPTKTIERAIKKVWASLWYLRAFDEREYYKIDQHSVAMGVMVHRSFPDEDANGVIITKNLYNVNHGYTFNVQYKEYSIVYPEPGILNDQILVYTLSLNEESIYTIEYLTHSNVPELNGSTVLTNEEITELADYCKLIKDHYFYNLPHNCNCAYKDFAVDLELKVDSSVESRKIYIKQARIYAD